MAAQSLIEQHIVFIAKPTTPGIDDGVILANPTIQSIAAGSTGSGLLAQFRDFMTWNGSQWSAEGFYEIVVFCSSAFQATIQGDIPTLQSAFPQYTIFTWGHPATYGN